MRRPKCLILPARGCQYWLELPEMIIRAQLMQSLTWISAMLSAKVFVFEWRGSACE